MERCRVKARKGQVISSGRAVTMISAPSDLVVFVQGMGMVTKSRAGEEEEEVVREKRNRVPLVTWCLERNRAGEGTVSSPKRQQPQKAIAATAHTAASKGS